VISVALKTPLEIRLGICTYKTWLLHRPDDCIGFTPSCPPHILQQNCAHAYMYSINLFSSNLYGVSHALLFSHCTERHAYCSFDPWKTCYGLVILHCG